jgi:hypothetical protein
MDELGVAGSIYREKVYKGFSEKQTDISVKSLEQFFNNILNCTDHTIRSNKRKDNLFHSYNLIQKMENGDIGVRHLYEMLEGQVAVLSAGMLDAEEVLEVLEAMPKSALYRKDQESYILYPDRQLPRFDEKNHISEEQISSSALLQNMVNNSDHRIVEKDTSGHYHFNGNFHNQHDVQKVLGAIRNDEYAVNLKAEQKIILDIFEKVFDHQTFTGRSGTFFGYEGLGSIYWHMVSKLLLAAQENCIVAIENKSDLSMINQLIAHYYAIRKGIGFNKTPDEYGAFPTDPYSHTPGNKGAKQPGMTGQVKEDILARIGELGVFVRSGHIVFNPRLLMPSEFIAEATMFFYRDVNGADQQIELPANSMAFTYCQIPVIYSKGDVAKITLVLSDGKLIDYNELKIDANWSTEIFNRSGKIVAIKISFDDSIEFAK